MITTAELERNGKEAGLVSLEAVQYSPKANEENHENLTGQSVCWPRFELYTS